MAMEARQQWYVPRIAHRTPSVFGMMSSHTRVDTD